MRIFLLSLLFLAFSLPSFAFAEKILDVQTVKSASGIEAWLVEDKAVPVISISFSFEGGLAFDPEDKPGVGRLVSILLDEGAGDMDSQAFQASLANNAIHMGFTAGRDAFYGQIKTLKDKKDVAFKLLHMALTQARFDADAIERMKNANVSQIKDDMGDPSWLVARTFNGMVFEGHYYARPGFGDLESMDTITRKDLQEFAKTQFARNVLKVAIAGDISKEEAQKALDDIFGSLPEKTEFPDESQEAQPKYAGKTILLPLDTPQTYIAAGAQGVKRADPAWFPAVIMNYILGGGGFDSRLMTEIREKRGLTYGVYSTLNSMKYAGVIQANLSASNEKAAEALSLLKKEWAAMAANGPTPEELQDAKSYLTGSVLLDLTSTNDISDMLNGMQRDGLGPNYINELNDALNAVTIGDVKKTAAKILKADDLAVILVGKPKNINADIMLDHPPGMRMPASAQ